MEKTQSIKEILNLKLLNNDIHLVKLIMSFNIDFCDECDKICYDEITEQYCYGCKEYFKVCDVCFNDNHCSSCDDYYCDDCQKDDYEFRKCDNERCGDGNKKYCEDCANENLGYCMGCEERCCCKKIYRTIGPEHNYHYTCEDCLECIFDP